jgi:hypothetical protein
MSGCAGEALSDGDKDNLLRTARDLVLDGEVAILKVFHRATFSA